MAPEGPTFAELAADPPFLAYQDLRSQAKERIHRRFLARLDEGAREKDRLCALDLDALAARAAEVRRRLLEAIGGLPEAGPLEAATTGVVETRHARIEKVVLSPRPGVRATAALHVPAGLRGRAPAVLFLCGHDRDAKASPQYQAACSALVRAGLVVLALDPVGQGERFGYRNADTGDLDVRWGCPEHDHAGAQCLAAGLPSARYFLHDAMRAVDYLASRPEVDSARIGATGNSGGGTQTALLMMADPRLAAAAPATYLTGMGEYLATGIAQDLEQIWPGLLRSGFDHDDVLLAMAPRPVLVLFARHDYFPPEGTRRTLASARRFWAAHGAADALESFEDDDEHRYSGRMATHAADFFSRRLLGRPAEPAGDEEPPLPPEALRCTVSGQVSSDFPGASFLFEENLAAFRAFRARRADLSDTLRRDEMRGFLRAALREDANPGPLDPRRFLAVEAGGMAVESLLWRAEPGVHNAALVFRAKGSAAPGGSERLVLAVWDGGTRAIPEHADWIAGTCRAGAAVAVADLTGCGNLELLPVNGKPLHAFEGTYCALAHDLLWLGDSWPALRARGVLRAVEALAEAYGVPRESIEGFGSGAESLPLVLAAFAAGRPARARFDPPPPPAARIVEQRLYDATGVLEGILPGLAALADVPDFLRWLAGDGAPTETRSEGGAA